jgi:DNA polymerase-1
MIMNIKLTPPTAPTVEKIRQAESKKKEASYQPSWEEVWETGYGKKKGILQTKLTDTDREKLLEVKKAIEDGEISAKVDDLRKFSKSHALLLYKHLIEKRREKIIKQMEANKPTNYHLISTKEDLLNLLSYLSNESLIALDTETTGLEYEDRIVGISMSLEKYNEHFYIPVRHIEGHNLSAEVVFSSLKPFLEDYKLKKVLHNAKFDFMMFNKEGVEVKGLEMDTMVAMTVLNENEESYALKYLATKYGRYFGFEDKSLSYEELFGNTRFDKILPEVGMIYACKDTHLTLSLYKWIRSHLEKQPKLYSYYYDIENKIVEISYEMEKNGLLVDLDFAKKYEEGLERELNNLKKQLDQYFPNINIASPKQLSEFLFNKLKLPNLNNNSVDADTLKALEKHYEGISVLLKFRELNKLLSTYIKPLPQMVWDDGRLHGQFNQSATVTGRFASRNPNLQNIPPEARKIFVAPEGMIMVSIDLSAIEPRILAHMSGDKGMQQPFIEGKDLYSTLASKIFNKTIEECGDGSKYRKMMKVGLLAVMYGVSTKSLAEQLGITEQEAEQFMKDFLGIYPKVREFIEKTHKEAFSQGYVEMMFGRKRRFHNELKEYKSKIASSNWAEQKEAKALAGRIKRQSVNSKIQGSASIILKKGMIECYNYCKERGWEFVATIHDENIFYIPENTSPEEIEGLGRCMTDVVKLDVPLKCDIEVYKRWGKGIPFYEWIKQKESE